MTAYTVVTVLLVLIAISSADMKVRGDPKAVKIIHETLGVPLKYFRILAACEIAGGVAAAVGMWWPPLGVAAGIGLVIYFAGAALSHVRVADFKYIGSAIVMLGLAAASLALRIVTM